MISTVTGGAGLIGSYLVDLLLAKGHEVRVVEKNRTNADANLAHHINNPNLKIFYTDICKIKSNFLAFKNADYVFHLAGLMDLVPSIEHPQLYMGVNVGGTVRVLEAARRAKVKRFVYAASSSCYGPNPPNPTPETAPIHCAHPYAFSKWAGEQACFHWHHVYNLPVVSIRIFNAFGPRLRGTPVGTSKAYGAVFGVFLKQKLSGVPFTVVGDGLQGRDFVAGKDVADAFYRAAVIGCDGEAYNIGGGKPQSVNRIIELLGGGEVIHLPKRPGEPDVTWADISKAQDQLKWSPQVSFEEAVAEIVAQASAFEHMPLWDKDSIGQATEKWFDALQK